MTDATDDLYATLGVARDANGLAIKRAYRRLAMRWHPDRNPGDPRAEPQFKRIALAFAVLSDARRRALYDEFGAAALRQGFDPARARAARSGRGAADDAARWFDGPTWAESVRAAAAHSPDPTDDRYYDYGGAGEDGDDPFAFGADDVPDEEPPTEFTLELDLATALRGGEVAVSVAGVRRTVRLPAGARDGSRLHVPGAGPSREDLRLTVRVRPHPHYWLEGDDLHVRVPVTVGEAYLGARVRVPTAEGAVLVTVPPLAPRGSRMRVAGHGAPVRGGSGGASARRGDLIVHLEVVLPDRDDEGGREAARALDRAAYARDVRAALRLDRADSGAHAEGASARSCAG